ncbi:glycyl-radical enzyme activating protein [Lachnospiraceae bacterium ASD3451]|uniref:glycyl-radical enzyme activating protein n=1 Tax=Diplocloster agilis TaxID=2850323 RepID=UPI001DEBF60E|nr:glycyl-radical enzyme activating protein [Diplocloster agilis]MBU9742946.1 glycyl-radical enzyme activating protein [Diplocloster agilis]
MEGSITGIVFDLEKFAVVDGPGVRTAIFLKGCPLQCIWCHNPESQEPKPQSLYSPNLCIRCGACIRACGRDALSMGTEGIVKDSGRCRHELLCAEACPAGAMKRSGKTMTAEAVYREAAKNKNFYRNSNGGVTASGGEPLMQWKFVKEIFRLCRTDGIQTALDTCGFAKTSHLREVLAYTDLVMYDLKAMDSSLHKKFTGVPNEKILENLKVVAESGVPYLIRIPLIPHYNATLANITATGEFLRGLRKPVHIELLPYHNMAKAKYDWIKGFYELNDLECLTDEEISQFGTLLEHMGFPVQIGG